MDSEYITVKAIRKHNTFMKQLFADLHCDTVTTLYDRRKAGSKETLLCNSLQLDIQKMENAHYLLQNFAVFLDKSVEHNLCEEALHRIDFLKTQLLENKDRICQITSYEEILQNEKAGMMSALLTLEGGEILEGRMENLSVFHEKGVRMITLTWNHDNELGYSHFDTEGNGLTKLGMEVVERMEDLHMIVDVSHGSDALFEDVCKIAKKPFVASHSNARSIYDRSRNMTDSMIHALAERGGVIGINYFAGFTSARSREDGMCYLEDILQHMKHIYRVGGVECLALGSDFDGIGTEVEWLDASGMELFLRGMEQAGFTPSECDKITRENVLRVYKECL